MNLIAVGLIIILLVVMVYVYYYFNPTLLNNGNLIDLSQNPQLTITLDEDVLNSKRYFYEGWLRVDGNPDYSKTYVVFNRGQDFIVALTGHRLSILYGKDRDTSATTSKIDPNKGEVPTGSFTVMDIARNFPFQKWTYFCINVDGNTMDTYLDGKLTKSITKPAFTDATISKPGSGTYASGDKLLFTTFNNQSIISVGNATLKGGIARFRFETGNMDPQAVWNIYSMGPGVTDSDESDEYHGKIKLTKNNKDKRVISLF